MMVRKKGEMKMGREDFTTEHTEHTEEKDRERGGIR